MLRQMLCLVIATAFIVMHGADRIANAQVTANASRADERESKSLQLTSLCFEDLAQAGGVVNLVSPPISMPRVISSNAQLPKEIAFVNLIPAASPLYYSSTNKQITDVLKYLGTKVTVGQVKLSPDAERELELQRRLLFTAAGEETSAYKGYLQYQKSLEDLDEKLASASLTSSEKAQLELRKQRIEDDWKDRPSSREIESAVSFVRSNDTSDERKALMAWRNSLATPRGPQVSLQDLGELSGWRSVAFSNTEPTKLTIRGSKEGIVKSLELKQGQVRISLQHKRIPVKFPDLNEDVLSSRLWTIGNEVLSDGETADDTRELLPRVFTHLILAKDLQVTFLDKDLAEEFQDFISVNEEFSVGGILFTPLNSYVLPFSISISRPVVIGVVIKSFPRIPNPAVGLMP